MKRRKTVMLVTAVVAALALGSTVWAAVDFSSSQSNLGAIVDPGGPGQSNVTYSFNFGFSVSPNVDGLSRMQYEALVDAALDQAKEDVMAQYDNLSPPSGA